MVKLLSSTGISIPVFVDQVFCRRLPQGAEPLWTVRAHPNEISSGDWVPTIIQAVNTAAGQHQEPMLHHMHFDHGKRRARLEGHGIYREIKTQAGWNQGTHGETGVTHERLRIDRIFAAREKQRRRGSLEYL